jgi:hypothetical protein
MIRKIDHYVSACGRLVNSAKGHNIGTGWNGSIKPKCKWCLLALKNTTLLEAMEDEVED